MNRPGRPPDTTWGWPADWSQDDLHLEMGATLLAPGGATGLPWQSTSPCSAGSMLGRCYERLSDRAVTVGRRVVFVVTREQVGGDTTLVLA